MRVILAPSSVDGESITMPDYAGIYAITNTVVGRVYIGRSKHVHQRMHEHKLMLTENVHTVRLMQLDYASHGINSFEFKVLEYCRYDDFTMKRLEAKYIMLYLVVCDLYNLQLNLSPVKERLRRVSVRLKRFKNRIGSTKLNKPGTSSKFLITTVEDIC